MAHLKGKQDCDDAKTNVEQEDGLGRFSNGSDAFRVGVKIPPFWPQEPAVWFAQVEGQFALSALTADTTKFCYVLSQLEHQYAAEIKDIIVKPPAVDKYETLKRELIARLSVSREKELKNILTHEELGDRKPSQFLRHLQHLECMEVKVPHGAGLAGKRAARLLPANSLSLLEFPPLPAASRETVVISKLW